MSESVPARALPLLFITVAHVALMLAALALALEPRSIAGFYYHPRMLAVVHLVTLGWITSSILGYWFLVAPLAFRAPLPARPLDWAVAAAFIPGLAVMVAGFWTDTPRRAAAGASVVAVAMVAAALRGALALRRARAPLPVRAHVACAFANLALSAAAGLLLGWSKAAPFLPGHVLGNVAAHAHLAAVGFALMMVMGAGYRMLPMILPAAMPAGPMVWAGLLLTESGVLALALGLAAWSPLVLPGAVLVVAGLAAFASRVAWMVRNRRPPPSALRRPDLGALQVAAALVWAPVAVGSGLALAARSEPWPELVMVYGTTGLLGLLAQVVVGVSARLLPMAAWLWSFTGGGHVQLPPASPHAATPRGVQAAGLIAWTAAAVLLAFGLHGDRPGLVSAGGACLLAGGAASALTTWQVLRRLRLG